jgi:tetratricopeptide (TPR) repeat protein
MAPAQSFQPDQQSELLESLHLPVERVGALPPELRDALLDFTRTWAAPHDLLVLVTALRESHGPLLFLLDEQAIALLRSGDAHAALETIERRQRRSTTIQSQAMEARALLAAGYEEHALDVVKDISQAYPRSVVAITVSAEILTGLGRFEDGAALLRAYLEQRPGDLEAILSMASLALRAGQEDLVAEYSARLGSGIPAGITDPQLQRLQLLMEATGQAYAPATGSYQAAGAFHRPGSGRGRRPSGPLPQPWRWRAD